MCIHTVGEHLPHHAVRSGQIGAASFLQAALRSGQIAHPELQPAQPQMHQQIVVLSAQSSR